MKRLIPMTVLMILLCAACARAEIWFPDGNTLHRDPLCIHNDFSAESCLERTITLTRSELEDTDYLPCTRCCTSLPADASPDAPSPAWYFNPNGGEHLHRDPDCPSVSAEYRPLPEAERVPAQVLPATVCNICGHASGTITSLFDAAVWSSTPEEKARMLPGVWTLPSESAIPFTQAMDIAKGIAATWSHKTVHSAIAFHYDQDDQGNPRDTWQVVVTTTLMQPVCIVRLDALTGEYISVRLSREYGEKMLLSDPSKLELEVEEGTKVEIIYNQVNFRNKPKGGENADSTVITRFNTGDMLTLLSEKRYGSNLWYLVSSPRHGSGYVDATYAQIVHDDKPRGNSGALTENTLDYCAELRRWQIEAGFLQLRDGDFIFVKDEALNTDANREALVALMHKHGITATVGGTAPFILANHYGTADLWEIFGTTEDILPGLHVDDWHSPENPTASEQLRLADALSAVDDQYK